jgi:glycosyltransferase involved in cell wall biosynthesis
MLRPIIVTSPNPFGTGGQARNYYVLLKLIKYLKDPVLILDIAPKNVVRELEALGYNVILVPSFSKTLESEHYLARVLLLIDALKGDYDLIVSQSEHPKYVMAAYTLHKLLKVPWTTILQSYLWLNPTRYKLSLTTITRTLIALKLLNRTHVYVVSEAIPYFLKKAGYPLRLYSLLDIPVGLNFKIIDNILKENVEKQYDIAYMARVTRGKGILDLVYIVHKMKRMGIDPSVLILGEFEDKTLKEKFFRYIYKLNIAKNFKLVGFVSGEKKYRMLAMAKIFLYPSKVDAFPISLLEALSVGLPAIVPKTPFANRFKDVVILTRSLDEMIKSCYTLLLDENQRLHIGMKSISFARRFTYDSAAKSEYTAYLRTLKLYSNYEKTV